jgi:hypothetical protein
MTKPNTFDEILSNTKAKDALFDVFETQGSKARVLVRGPKSVGKHMLVSLFLKCVKLSCLKINLQDYQHNVSGLIDLVAPLQQSTHFKCKPIKNVLTNQVLCVVVDGFEHAVAFDRSVYDALIQHVLEPVMMAPVIVICDHEAINEHMKYVEGKCKIANHVVLKYLTPLERGVFINKVIKRYYQNKLVALNKREIDDLVARSKGTFADCLANTNVYLRTKNKSKPAPLPPTLVAKKPPLTLDEMEAESMRQSDDDVFAFDEDKDDDYKHPMKEPTELEQLLHTMLGASKWSRRYTKRSIWLEILYGVFKSKELLDFLQTKVVAKNSPLARFEKTLALFGFSVHANNLEFIDARLYDMFATWKKHCQVKKEIDTGEYFRRNEPDCDDGYGGDLYKPSRPDQSREPIFKKPNLINVDNRRRKRSKPQDTQLTLDMLLVKKRK